MGTLEKQENQMLLLLRATRKPNDIGTQSKKTHALVTFAIKKIILMVSDLFTDQTFKIAQCT